MPRLTKKAWFGPKRVGWGWRVTSWEGALVTVVSLAAIIAVGIALHRTWLDYVAVAGVLGLWLGVILLTGDSPGGQKR